MDLPVDSKGLTVAAEETRKLLKQIRIRLALARIKETGLRGPGRPRRVLPVSKERIMELLASGSTSLRALSRKLTSDTGTYVSREAIQSVLRSTIEGTQP